MIFLNSVCASVLSELAQTLGNWPVSLCGLVWGKEIFSTEILKVLSHSLRIWTPV